MPPACSDPLPLLPAVDCHKYFGAPWGAMLLGPAELVKPLFHERRMLGGACTNAALAAAMALEGMKTFPVRRLAPPLAYPEA